MLKPKAKPTRPAEGKVESRSPKRARRTSSSPRSPPCPQSRPQAQSQLSEPRSREQSRESCMKTLSQARSQLGVRLNHMRTHNQGMKILVHVKAVVAQDKLGGICIAAAISSLQHTSVAVVTPKCRFTFLALQPHMRPQCLCPSVARRQRGLWKQPITKSTWNVAYNIKRTGLGRNRNTGSCTCKRPEAFIMRLWLAVSS